MVNFRQMFKNRKKFSIKIQGNSMYPLLRSGDIAHFQSTAFAKIKVNDVVLVNHDNEWFVHRVVYKNPQYVLTQGDSNQKIDGIIESSEVFARVWGVTRGDQRYHLKEIYSIQALLYGAEIEKIQKSLKKRSIDHLFLKGLPLYMHYFKAIPHRLLADCDLLVNFKDVDEVDQAFKKIGYKKREENYPLSFSEYTGQTPTEAGFIKYIRGFPVIFDVHYEIAARTTHFNGLQTQLKTLTSQMMSRKQHLVVRRKLFPALDRNDLVIYLLLHLVNHLWGGFFRFDLLVKVLGKEGGKINWHYIFTEAKQKGFINYIFPSIYYLDKFYKMSQPLNVYKKFSTVNYFYSLAVVRFFFRSATPESYNSFRWHISNRVNKFLLRFLLYDRPFMAKLMELFKQGFVSYVVYFFFKQTLRSRRSSGTGQQKADLQA